MNLFITDPCPMKCAQYLDDKRVVKMVLETAQMLSTAVNEAGGKGPYKSTHVNHPCSKWVRENQSNYKWTLLHFSWLCSEYLKRYGKVHKCEQYEQLFMDNLRLFSGGVKTTPPNCAANKDLGISYKDMTCIYTAYRLYLNDRWDNDKREPTWYRVAR